MHEQLISFETAKLAKELGFKPSGVMMGYVTKFYRPSTKTLLSYGRTGRSKINDLIYAPTQSLLQRWLRDENMMSIKIDDFYTDGQIKFDYNISVLGSQDDNPIGNFNTYEEALEEALLETLTYLKNELNK